jgi:phage N-6-adenine-methyltransferase
MKGHAQLMSSARTGKSEQDEWRTPPGIVEAITETIGEITFDAWATAANSISGTGGIEFDSFSIPDWRSEGVVYCNPPYSRMKQCAERMVEQQSLYRFPMVSLVPARVETRWWSELTSTCDQVVFLSRRVKFIMPDGTEAESGAPFPSALVLHDVSPARAKMMARRVGGTVWAPLFEGRKRAPMRTLRAMGSEP